MTERALAELAPGGLLRVGLNHSNFLIVNPGSSPAEPTGIAADLAREIAQRLGVPAAFVAYDGAGKMADDVAAWDIAFMGAEPAREAEIAFTAAYLEIEAGYLVPPGSPIRAIEEVDREGVRIAAADRSAYGLFLERTLKHAQLVGAAGIEASYKLFASEKLEVLAGLKPRLLKDLERLPGSRILDGHFTAIQQAIATPRARPAAAAYLSAFVEEAKASGLVAQAIRRHGVRGVNVAPAAA